MKTCKSSVLKWIERSSFLFFLLFFVSPLYSNVKLPGVLTSNMVLQRNKEIKIWGWADKCERIEVSFNNTDLSVKAGKDGKWMLIFPAMKEGGPYTIVVKGKNKISLENIMIGDVWVCSGQSNMEFNLKSAKNGASEIQKADYPKIRLLTIPKNLQFFPVDDVQGIKWEVCSPQTAEYFSAVGYFFGREIGKQVNVPIGLINTSWGGTVVEAWTSSDFLARVDDFKERMESLEIKTPEELKAEQIKFLEKLYIRFGLTPPNPADSKNWNQSKTDLKYWEDMDLPGLWESNGLGEVDGVVWFRREVTIPEELAGKEWTLKLGKIDDSDQTFINGVAVGETVGRYNDLREYIVKPGLLKPGVNTIAVRVHDTGGGGGFWGEKEDMKMVCTGHEIPLSGSWKYRLSLELLSVNDSNNPNNIPACLFNGMINPLLNLGVKGAIWYQGESNASRAYQYRTLFPLMIEDWRNKWNQPGLPFFFVQLANFMQADSLPVESEWAELREAQSMTLSLPATGMAVIIDIGEANDIHPTNKQDVGFRLALQALRLVYGKDITCNGPVFKSIKIEGDKAVLSFETQGSNLLARDKYGYLKGFAIAGEDKKFYWATGYIKNGQVIISSDMVKNPVAVRYAWANNPEDANLYNIEGIPASPFRTDSWDGLTLGNK